MRKKIILKIKQNHFNYVFINEIYDDFDIIASDLQLYECVNHIQFQFNRIKVLELNIYNIVKTGEMKKINEGKKIMYIVYRNNYILMI